MARFMKSASGIGLGLGLSVSLLGGCAVHSTEMTTLRTTPTVDQRAASILAENALNSRQGQIQLVAGDAAGLHMYGYAVAFAQARATGRPMPREFATVWVSPE